MDSLVPLKELVTLELLAKLLPKSILEVSIFKDRLDSLAYVKQDLNEKGLEIYEYLKESEFGLIKKLDSLGVDPLTLVFTTQEAVSIRYKIVSNVSVHPGILGVSYQLLSIKPLLSEDEKFLSIELVTKIMSGVDTASLKEILAELKTLIKDRKEPEIEHLLKQLENIV